MSEHTKIVAITSRKGGVGKSVSSMLLARYFTEIEGKRVVVIDLDPRGGITSALHDQPLRDQDPSISDVIATVRDGGNAADVFYQSLIRTKYETTELWKDGDGSLMLLPAKKSLESFLDVNSPFLLQVALQQAEVPKGTIVIIDTGSSSGSVLTGVASADVVFVPLKLSKLDVHPAVETIRTIILKQLNSDGAVLGGIIVNHLNSDGPTKWEKYYMENYNKLITQFINKNNLNCVPGNLFIPLVDSRLILSGVFMDYTFRKTFLVTAKKMANAIHAVAPRAQGVE